MADIEWETPQKFFNKINVEFGFDIDVCATWQNAKCKQFFSLHDDGLSKNWDGICWCNPPFDKTMENGLKRLIILPKKGQLLFVYFLAIIMITIGGIIL